MAQKPENLITYAKSMRKDPTPAEAILWRYLRSKRFGNIKFRRQHPIPPYIVDFFCAVERLVIELDGESHIGKEAYDAQRQLFLEQQGLTVLRFWDTEIYDHLPMVLDVVEHTCSHLASGGRSRLRPKTSGGASCK